jgi:hypothetical protein
VIEPAAFNCCGASVAAKEGGAPGRFPQTVTSSGWLGALFVAGIAITSGCSSDDGSPSRTGSAGSSGTSAVSDAARGLSPECIRCVVSACSAEYDACSSSAECQAVMDCALDCHDAPACLESCRAKNPEGGATWQLMYACVQNDCGLCITPQ